ncbi:hypothetical protein J2S02_004575 [Metabacillus niabensis]|uniref:Uncharacterized protein n=1 Tax=Metabacillus niabensis TaxID=324854 RepID=A0ABT9Z869_9BACI|nr:hypothetical protein [Metabacillus niabensis]
MNIPSELLVIIDKNVKGVLMMLIEQVRRIDLDWMKGG